MTRSTLALILAAVIAAAGSALVLHAFGFDYNFLGDTFEPGKLAIDLGVFTALFLVSLWLLRKALGAGRKGG